VLRTALVARCIRRLNLHPGVPELKPEAQAQEVVSDRDDLLAPGGAWWTQGGSLQADFVRKCRKSSDSSLGPGTPP
jgi:hypothetical protein